MPQPRYTYRGSFIHDYFPPGVKWLMILNTVVFLIQYLFQGTIGNHIMLWFALRAIAVTHVFFVWEVFTYMFLHGGTWHLIFNMLALWMFGTQLERDWGTRRFVKYYLLCGTAAGVCVLIVNILMGDWNTATIGASGAIFGVLVAFGVMYPNQIVLMSFLFPIKAKYMIMIYAALELLVTFGPNTGVSTVAHLGGMAFGYLYLKGKVPLPHFGDLHGAYRQWKVQRAKRKFQVYMRKHGGGPWVN